MLSYLVRPFVYLSIRHTGYVIVGLNWVLPIALAAGVCLVMAMFAPSANVYGESGLLDKLLSFVQSLPGFYIAALAAVATFDQPSMDQLMAGQPPVAKLIYNGTPSHVQLTRRRFLCLMFSYLTAISITITMLLVVATALGSSVRVYVLQGGLECLQTYLHWGVLFLLLAATLQMVVVTFYGLFYLGERMHVADL